MPRPLVPAARAVAVEPFHVMRILARARDLEAQGRDIVHMEVGEPDFPTPAPIVQAGQQALADGLTRYTAAAGLPALREAISGYYAERLGVRVSPGRILVTPGASGALNLVLAALIDPGDEVLLADPGYPCYRHLVSLLGGRARLVPLVPDDGFRMTPEILAAAWSPAVRVVLLASPANPTGQVLDPADIAALYELVRGRGAALVVDEIYQGLVYDTPDHTALAAGEDGLFVVNSFSKYFGMTGWRVGWAVGPAAFAPVLDRIAQNLYLAAPTLAQHAALAAFAPATLAVLDARRDEFRRRRDYLVGALGGLGLRIAVQPGGAFYVFADSAAVSQDSEVLARDLLELGGVAVTPGRDFSATVARRYVRFAYSTDMARLRDGVGRIRGVLQC
jgi:aspartate/methionine/tyrosine aminotransferase